LSDKDDEAMDEFVDSRDEMEMMEKDEFGKKKKKKQM
jgi:hypothetical protein